MSNVTSLVQVAVHGMQLCAKHFQPSRLTRRAFQELGFECTSWTVQVYNDLLAQGNGTGEGLVAAYFNTVGIKHRCQSVHAPAVCVTTLLACTAPGSMVP